MLPPNLHVTYKYIGRLARLAHWLQKAKLLGVSVDIKVVDPVTKAPLARFAMQKKPGGLFLPPTAGQ